MHVGLLVFVHAFSACTKVEIISAQIFGVIELNCGFTQRSIAFNSFTVHYYLSTTVEESGLVLFLTEQQARSPARSPHCPFSAERQVGKLQLTIDPTRNQKCQLLQRQTLYPLGHVIGNYVHLFLNIF